MTNPLVTQNVTNATPHNAGMCLRYGPTRIKKTVQGDNIAGGDVDQNATQDLGDPIFTKNLRNHKLVDASYQVLNTDGILSVENGGVTISLPEATGYGTGRILVIKDKNGNAGTSSITIATHGSQTIDGASSKTISENYGLYELYTDGNNWFTISAGTGDITSNIVAYTAVGTNYSALSTDDVIGATSAGITITLLDATSVDAGTRVTVKDASGGASGSAITIDTDGGNIDGAASITIDVDYGSVVFVSDGTNWFSI